MTAAADLFGRAWQLLCLNGCGPVVVSWLEGSVPWKPLRVGSRVPSRPWVFCRYPRRCDDAEACSVHDHPRTIAPRTRTATWAFLYLGVLIFRLWKTKGRTASATASVTFGFVSATTGCCCCYCCCCRCWWNYRVRSGLRCWPSLEGPNGLNLNPFSEAR